MARPREFDEDAVLDAVMDTFWHYGYEATSAQDLVQATGLGRGSLYAAYTSKDGLFEQAMLRYNQRSRENVDLLRGPGPVLDCLRTLLVGVVYVLINSVSDILYRTLDPRSREVTK